MSDSEDGLVECEPLDFADDTNIECGVSKALSKCLS